MPISWLSESESLLSVDTGVAVPDPDCAVCDLTSSPVLTRVADWIEEATGLY